MAPEPPQLPDPLPLPATISIEDVKLFNAAYPRLIAHLAKHDPKKAELVELDRFRYEELPQHIARQRALENVKEGEKGGYIDKADLQKLMEWKLSVAVARVTDVVATQRLRG